MRATGRFRGELKHFLRAKERLAEGVGAILACVATVRARVGMISAFEGIAVDRPSDGSRARRRKSAGRWNESNLRWNHSTVRWNVFIPSEKRIPPCAGMNPTCAGM